MNIEILNKVMLDIFYERTSYEREKIFVVACDDLYVYSLEKSPCQKHKSTLADVSRFNGTSFPKYLISDGCYALISKNIISGKDASWMGTYLHEITHAHDFFVFADCIGAITADEIYDSQFFLSAMGVISEFNARRNGFSYVREQWYKFDSADEEWENIFSKEIPYLIKTNSEVSNLYSLTQLLGRMAVFDSKTKETARSIFYDIFLERFNTFTADKIIKMYEILYNYKDAKNNISLCLNEIHQIVTELKM